jgi:outer membrane protein OmpA-like peptidoglycan-associated protein
MMRRFAAALSTVAIAAGCASQGVQQQEIASKPGATGCELRIDIGGDPSERLSFPAGSAELDAGERDDIDHWIDGLHRYDCIPRISVVTRAEWTAPGEVDLNLAQRRASTIRDTLVERGIPDDQITTDVLGPPSAPIEAKMSRRSRPPSAPSVSPASAGDGNRGPHQPGVAERQRREV